MPFSLSNAIEDPAKPQTTSARGASFSASNFAVMIPVESRTHLILISGLAFSKPSLNLANISVSNALYTVSSSAAKACVAESTEIAARGASIQRFFIVVSP